MIPVPDSVRSTLEDGSDAMSDVIAILTGDDPVSWDLDGAAGGGAGVPTPARLTVLQRWLAAAAATAFDQGDADRASAALEASWRLNQTTLGRPERELRVAGYSALELELAVLRAIPRSVSATRWAARLDDLDPVKRVEEWTLVEASSLPATTKRGTILDEDGWWPTVLSLAVDPVRKWLLTSATESVVVSVATMSPADLGRLDPDLRFVDAHHRIPRWNRVARSALPNPWNEWLVAARAGLAVELASEVMRLESMTSEQLDDLLTPGPPRRVPSRVPGVIWMWTIETEAVRIRLVVETAPTPYSHVLSEPPLEHVYVASPTRGTAPADEAQR